MGQVNAGKGRRNGAPQPDLILANAQAHAYMAIHPDMVVEA